MDVMDTIEHKKKTSPKDIFLHLLAILALYASAGSFVSLIFQYINLYIPDPLQRDLYYVTAAYSSIRFAIATLVVIFPVYIWATWLLNKSYEREPEKRNLRIRKWLIYFTLFAAALIIMGYLVALIYSFLNGDLTSRFLLQMLTVFAVAGSVFWYYFRDLREHSTE